jgi:hypothetical protein
MAPRASFEPDVTEMLDTDFHDGFHTIEMQVRGNRDRGGVESGPRRKGLQSEVAMFDEANAGGTLLDFCKARNLF